MSADEMGAMSALAIATAMSLYQYNVAPDTRAEKLYKYFRGACAEPDELLRLVDSQFWATEMAAPTALRYIHDALERYAEEAVQRVEANLRAWQATLGGRDE